MTLAVRIGPTGQLCTATVSANELPSADVANCVAQFFRGLSVTVSVSLGASRSAAELRAAVDASYRGAPLVRVSDAPPQIAEIASSAAMGPSRR